MAKVTVETKLPLASQRGFLDPGGAKGEPMTFTLSDLGRGELDRRDREHSEAVKADAVRRRGL